MITINNLTKTFESESTRVKAIDGISLNIDKGQIFGIIGYSGAGKSTVLRCINRLEEPTSGQILIDGVDISSLSKEDLRRERKNIGMIFQNFNLLAQENVFNNIAFPLKAEKLAKNQIEERVNLLLKYVELEDKKYSYPRELSGGQKQRVAIARALANNPKVLLSDEATSALDPKTTKSILQLLSKIQKEMGLTIVMITHQMEVVKEICERVAIMENGRIVEENTVKEIFRNPKTKTAKLFIDSLQGDVEEEFLDPQFFKGKLIRLSFLGENSKAPIVSKLIKTFDVDVNILSGNINKLQESNVGHLILELIGPDEQVENSIDFLKDNQIHVEVI